MDEYPVNFRIEFKCYLIAINMQNHIQICNKKIAKRLFKRYIRHGLLAKDGSANTRQKSYINNIMYEQNLMENKFIINFVIKDWRDSDNNILEDSVRLESYIMENIWPADDYIEPIILMVNDFEYKIKYLIKSIEFSKT